MAPEQIRGQPVDGRADLFALGVVLYEMLTGARAFARETTAETLTAILKEDPPDLTTARADLPPAIERIVRHALEKNPTERFQTARDVAFALEALGGSGAASGAGVRVKATSAWSLRGPRVAWTAAVTGLGVAALALASVAMRQAPREAGAADEWVGELLGGSTVAFAPRVSPDGRTVAFHAMVDDLTQIAVMRPDTGNWRVLTADRSIGAVGGFTWSSDGNTIFFDRVLDGPRGVFAVPMLGGDERLVLENAMWPVAVGDGTLLVTRYDANGVWQLHRFWPETGAVDALGVRFPWVFPSAAVRVVPGGREAVFFGTPESEPEAPPHLHVMDLATARTRRLAPGLAIPSFAWQFPLAVTPDARWVLFDLPAGTAHRIVAVPADGSAGMRTLLYLTARPLSLDVANDGSLYVDQIDQPSEILRHDAAEGRVDRSPMPSTALESESLLALPDGRLLVGMRISGRRRLMATDFGGVPTPFVQTDEETAGPTALLGRDRVVLTLGSPGTQVLAVVRIADGRVVSRLEGVRPDAMGDLSGSADGRTLYFTMDGAAWTIPVEGGAPRRLAEANGLSLDPAGRYLLTSLHRPDGVHLVRVSLAGAPDEPLRLPKGPLHVSTRPLTAGGIAADGRIVIRVARADSWFWYPAILDPSTGTFRVPPFELDQDITHAQWDAQGRLVAIARRAQASLWRFRPVSSPLP